MKKRIAFFAIPLGTVSTLLTWFIYRVGECKDVFSCAGQILNRGLPLTWVTTVEMGWTHILRMEWLGLAVDLLVWIFFFAALIAVWAHLAHLDYIRRYF